MTRGYETIDGEKMVSYQRVVIELNAQIACGAIKKEVALDILEHLPVLNPVSTSEIPNKWIPVSERLPEERQSVLVWCPEYKNMYCAYLENKNWWIFGAFSQIIPNAVIAWMPLPEPYKAESEENT